MQDKKFKVVTFDLDDTLWECLPVIQKAEIKLRQWLDSYYPKITSTFSIDDFINYRQKIVDNNPDYAFDFSYIRQTFLYNIAIESGYSETTASLLQQQGFEIFITERSNVVLYDDVIPAFTILSQHFQLGALTNGNVDLTKTLLHSYFNFTLNATTAGYAKPDSRFFEYACNLAKVAACDIVHIGDHPEHDVQGANGVGIETVWLNRNNTEWPDLPKPNNIIFSLNELPKLLLGTIQ